MSASHTASSSMSIPASLLSQGDLLPAHHVGGQHPLRACVRASVCTLSKMHTDRNVSAVRMTTRQFADDGRSPAKADF